MTSRARMWLTAGALMTAAVSVRAGGWSVITVSELPEFVRAGEPFTLTYAVRQHGVSPVSDLRGRIEAKSDDKAVIVAAATPAAPGFYKATLTLPRAGRWTLNVSSGFVEGMTGRGTGEIYRDGPPMNVMAVAATAPRPAAQTPAERGLHLYVAKGCVTCHAHARSDVQSYEIGPALTGVRRSAADLRTILTHGIAGRDQTEYAVRMPNLGLRPDETDALIAFLQPTRSGS